MHHEECIEMLKEVSQAIINNVDVLTDADRAIGDGDHGIGMRRGFEAALEVLESKNIKTVEEVFNTVGMAIMSKTGGAAGVVFGTFFCSGAKAFSNNAAIRGDNFVKFLEVAQAAVAKRGGVEEGQKTMVDAIAPAARSAKAANTEDIAVVFSAAARGALAGVEKTKSMIATTGKARSMGERSIGHPDPGAISISIILGAMQKFASRL
ncbi:MAG: dihydroxyacetone kinase subunit DhaL [Bacteroidetes bacterium]|nr:dihydroxyacetone kinase subunit DhaL [Bacteroidota bacterium]MDA1122383.1 dihydroxyacetone kinase subunit DhaL [Bacteroidota bacterium]